MDKDKKYLKNIKKFADELWKGDDEAWKLKDDCEPPEIAHMIYFLLKKLEGEEVNR